MKYIPFYGSAVNTPFSILYKTQIQIKHKDDGLL